MDISFWDLLQIETFFFFFEWNYVFVKIKWALDDGKNNLNVKTGLKFKANQ